MDAITNKSAASIGDRSITIRLLKCRICACLCDRGILVFSDEGKKRCLQAHIKKYLYILISMDDKLTKLICTACCKKIENFHQFAMMASQSQGKLITQTGYLEFLIDDLAKTNNHQEAISPKSLLHAYLTKETFNMTDHDYIAKNPIIDGKTSIKKRKRTTKTKRKRIKVKSEDKIIKNEQDNLLTNIKTEETTDSNTHETLEVIVDPSSLFLENTLSCDETENKILADGHTVCSICDLSFSSKLEERESLCAHCKSSSTNLNSKIKFENNNFVGDDIETAQHFDNFDYSESDFHEILDRDGQLEYACPICGKLNFSNANLKLHLRIHRPKGKYECDICKRIFKSPGSLLQHKVYHNRVQFKCDICGRVYPTKSTLKAHSITHSDLRPHKCQLCDKSFKRNQDLKFHMNQHTGARPYKCIYCPKAFASSGNCFSHRKRMHPDEVERDRDFAAQILR